MQPLFMETPPPTSRRRFAFVTSNRMWGGSEELWAATAAELAAEGHHVTIYRAGTGEDDSPRLQRLRELGCRIQHLERLPIPRTLYSMMSGNLLLIAQLLRLRFALRRSRCDLIIFSQGINFDGVDFGNIIRKLERPYVLILQKASELYWPHDFRLDSIRALYRSASACYFVSEHNLRLTEEQIGMALPHAKVVRNPFLVSWQRRNDWPSTAGGFRLACVGRMHTTEKGQDIVLRVLARTKWRNRPLSVTFFGEGTNRRSMEALAKFHSLHNVSFAGQVADPAAIWNDHHALLLASRCEGLPLVVVEAMLSGRVPIVTDVAGNAEVVDDDRTGFLAAAPTEDAVDEALERAWRRRDEWRAIGAAAADCIRDLVPPDPARVLASMLTSRPAAAAADDAGYGTGVTSSTFE